jgi:uncharacterized protein YwqG
MFFRKSKQIHHLKQDILDLEAKINGMKYNARMLQIFIDDAFPLLFLAQKNYSVNTVTIAHIYKELGMIK